MQTFLDVRGLFLDFTGAVIRDETPAYSIALQLKIPYRCLFELDRFAKLSDAELTRVRAYIEQDLTKYLIKQYENDANDKYLRPFFVDFGMHGNSNER